MVKKSLIMASAIVPITASFVHASGETGIVTANVLNVRSGVGTGYSVIGKVYKGDEFNLLESKSGWYKIKYRGKDGWVSGSYIAKKQSSGNNSTNGGTSSNIKKGKSTANLNMRNGAGTSYRVITTLPKGTTFDIESLKGEWYTIMYKGRRGYVHKGYVRELSNSSSNNISTTPNKPTIPTTPNESVKGKKQVNASGLNVRSGAGTSYSVVGKLNRGEIVDYISEVNSWTKIKYKGKDAYVSSKYLENVVDDTVVKPPTPIPESPSDVKPIAIKEVNYSAVNVRKGPGTNHSILGSLVFATKVEVISESRGWSKIKYKDGYGYIATMYLDLVDESNGVTLGGGNNSSDNSGNGGDVNIGSEGVEYKKLSYTLQDHIDRQMERVSVGGNVISSSKPRSLSVTVDREYIPAVANYNVTSIPISRGFVPAELDDIEYFLTPSNFTSSKKGMMQFLRLDEYREGITASQLNGYLNKLPKNDGKGGNVFYNQGQTFIESAKKYNIDVIYLVAHAMWETGYGGSTLAKGQTITSYKGEPLESPVTVYNFYGIGAIDGSANLSGAEASYSNGWTSIEKTIEGSANWIAKNYIHSSKYKQNTIYKMKFNYDYTWHQYATDVNWANGISNIMLTVSELGKIKGVMKYEVPQYK